MAALTINPKGITAPAGISSGHNVAISGGLGPYSLVRPFPQGVSFEGTILKIWPKAKAQKTTLTFGDKSTPRKTGTVALRLT